MTCTPLAQALREFALHFEFTELGSVVGVGKRVGAQTVADAERNAVSAVAMIQFNLGKIFQVQLT